MVSSFLTRTRWSVLDVRTGASAAPDDQQDGQTKHAGAYLCLEYAPAEMTGTTTAAHASTRTGIATQLLERNLFNIDRKPYATAFIDGAAVRGWNRHVPSSASSNTGNSQAV